MAPYKFTDRKSQPCVRCGAKVRRETHGGDQLTGVRVVREGESEFRGSSPTVREGVG